MKISEALKSAKTELDSSNLAWRFLSFYLKQPKEWVFLNSNLELENENEFFCLINRYKNGEPFEYITGVCEFLGREFSVGKGVLIPRFETEILVQKALNIAKNYYAPKICEIGIGSGVISISLALELEKAKFSATDISLEAIKFARKNIDKFGVEIEINHTSLLDGVNDKFDIIVSNPPYIADDYELDIWVKNEPKTALFGGANGDELLKQIINLAKTRTKYLICEIGYDQKASLSKELEDCGFEYEFYKDLAGFDRGFVAKIKE
ncbi:protein-(glutamine-N5) methyltransferase [Campylobacter iguaniorum]|uniref:peptide chain release factor N(5)-glutamine methyltransferase n=1 Tax=Campylobacter iguaniorum TaxID=1244531 RepID=UPI0007C919F8|nr:peptide chain release factor N(5)-glutamine methyltransferase [Campylobacter iguaniorum]ANE35688.1 protein-(glutamine-N5) methyltransferase [Campylobacter iguaniorum]